MERNGLAFHWPGRFRWIHDPWKRDRRLPSPRQLHPDYFSLFPPKVHIAIKTFITSTRRQQHDELEIGAILA